MSASNGAFGRWGAAAIAPVCHCFVSAASAPAALRSRSNSTALFVTNNVCGAKRAALTPHHLPPPTTHPPHVTFARMVTDEHASLLHRSDRPPTDHDHPPSSTPPPPAERPPDANDARALALFGGALTITLGILIALASGILSPDSLVSLAAWFEARGPDAVFLYGLFYFVLELVAVPAIPLTLGSGYLFGVFEGTVVVSIASTLAAAAAFLLSRYALRESFERIARRYPKFRAMDKAIGKQGFKVVFLLRLSPLLPFSLSNYLYGLTSVQFNNFFLGSWLGMLPGTIAYVSTGAALNALTDISESKPPVNKSLLVIGVIATIAVITLLGRIATNALGVNDEDEQLAATQMENDV